MTLHIPFDNTFAQLPPVFYTKEPPTPVADPTLIAWNTALADELGITGTPDPATLSGNGTPSGATPLAQLYAGHQFGHWNPQLGDGRALLLGEILPPDGERFDLQLKGSGPTPYSRMGDGRAWLGPVLREFLVSEAMHALGVPTTRALAVVATGETVLREAPYPGAVLTRIAQSHIRVGTFQFFAARGDLDAIRALTDHVLARHYSSDFSALDLLEAAIERQAGLIAKWMGLGFIHGVMNTDNCHVAGLTIDYGPCAFMDMYHPGMVFSSIDQHGRYAYGNQPEIAVWNLAQFATSLLPLIDEDQDTAVELATKAVHRFPTLYKQAYREEFGKKLGLQDPTQDDDTLIDDLLTLMAQGQADFTNTFRALGTAQARDQFTNPTEFDAWNSRWQARRDSNADLSLANPAVIPRNHRIEQAIQAAIKGDLAPATRLYSALSTPFELCAENVDLANPPSETERVRQTFCGT